MMCLSSSTSSASPLTSSRWISALSTPFALQVSPPSTPPSPLPWLLPPTSLHQWVNPAPLIFHTLKKRKSTCIVTSVWRDICLSVSSLAKTAALAFSFVVVVSHFQTTQPFVLWWILWILYLLTCQATVTVGDSHLCCCVCVQLDMRSSCCHWHSQGHKVWIFYENVCISLNLVWPKSVCLCIIIRWKCCVVSWSCSAVCFPSLFSRESLVFHWQVPCVCEFGLIVWLLLTDSVCLWVWSDCVTMLLTDSLCLWVWIDCVTVLLTDSVSVSLVWLCDCVIDRFSVWIWPDCVTVLLTYWVCLWVWTDCVTSCVYD